jgi:hypothetical protein
MSVQGVPGAARLRSILISRSKPCKMSKNALAKPCMRLKENTCNQQSQVLQALDASAWKHLHA